MITKYTVFRIKNGKLSKKPVDIAVIEIDQGLMKMRGRTGKIYRVNSPNLRFVKATFFKGTA